MSSCASFPFFPRSEAEVVAGKPRPSTGEQRRPQLSPVRVQSLKRGAHFQRCSICEDVARRDHDASRREEDGWVSSVSFSLKASTALTSFLPLLLKPSEASGDLCRHPDSWPWGQERRLQLRWQGATHAREG